MPSVRLPEGLSLHCTVDDYLWPWDAPTPVLMMHGFARNATFWNRWVPSIAQTRRTYRPNLVGCGKSETPAPGYSYTPEQIGAQILAVLDAFSVPAGSLGRRVLGRDHRIVTRRGTSRTHR